MTSPTTKNLGAAATPGVAAASHRPPIDKPASALNLEGMYVEASQVYHQNEREISAATQGQVKTSGVQVEDAFRHTYAAAVLTNSIAKGIESVKLFSTEETQKMALVIAGNMTEATGRGLEYMSLAHHGRDKNNHADVGMDLHNNAAGIQIARESGINATREQLRDAVMNEMAKGNLILTNADPRAEANFNSQLDLKAGQAMRDGAIATASFVSEKMGSIGQAQVTAANAMAPLKEGIAQPQTAQAGTIQGKDLLKALNNSASQQDRPTETVQSGGNQGQGSQPQSASQAEANSQAAQQSQQKAAAQAANQAQASME